MSKTIYLCTGKDSYDEEKIAFTELEDAESFLRDCIVYAFDAEDVDKDDQGYSKEECLDNWHMECGNYYAQIEAIELFD